MSSRPTQAGCCSAGLNRRQWFAASAGITMALQPQPSPASPPANRQAPMRHKLKIRPVLVYEISKPRPQTSWRPWGALHTEQDVAREVERIAGELKAMAAGADFPLEIGPVERATDAARAAELAAGDQHVTLIYGASGPLAAIENLARGKAWSIVFVRHRSGPVYLWYEIVHPRFLRKTVDNYGEPRMGVEDVVVDSYDDLLWRLRALHGLQNTYGKRVVAVGGAGGWGVGGRKAPEIARGLWKFDIIGVTYDDLGKRILAARSQPGRMEHARGQTEKYLKAGGVRLETQKDFLINAFLLTEVFRDLLDEAGTDTITINQCMSTIMPASLTTACMPLSVLNDEGYLAFCESDFVTIPAGVLLHYISGKPVFLNNPTFPHHGIITQAHCTAPRRMDGRRAEPVRILTHMESDYGAAPKVEMRKGQLITNVVPDFESKRWLGFEGEILEAPFMDICRSQIEVRLKADCERLAAEMRGFHWMTCYGSYLKETGYALRKAGVNWLQLS